MLIQHSSTIVIHRLASVEAQSLEARGALVAKHRGEVMIRQAIERLDAPNPEGTVDDGRVDRTA
ncbi:hypothetical protein [Pelagibacterium sp. H642]|uniref:hypothetical protein n=1 Tax=Pelagibacterium sp. H642 TaxID=1881069 RepID=UPI0028157783|nr:hypothetical protein [Pelagibacterium sp. H642]WMT89171.1 hypothetical protein NO934_10065 [Pelagibacterium sp. H642]